MNKQKIIRTNLLYYRLFVTYIEASPNFIKAINKLAFYRLTLTHADSSIAQMIEGMNPVVLGDKIFINNSQLNFSHPVESPILKIVLHSHFGIDDKTLATGELNLQKINENYFQFTQRFHSEQCVTMKSDRGILKLIFNAFVESNKEELNNYIKKFKDNQRAVMRAKRLASPKGIEHSPRIKTNQKENTSNENEAKNYNSKKKVSFTNSERQSEQNNSLNPVDAKKNKDKKVESSLSSHGICLQINSAAKTHQKIADKNISKIKNALRKIEEHEVKAFSSQLESYQTSNILSLEIPTTSIVSDGSEQSQMISANLKETYSERAVSNFKNKLSNCLNICFIIVGLFLIYFLLAPNVRHQKKIKMKTKSAIQVSDLQDI